MSGKSYHLLTFFLYLSLPIGTYFLGKSGAESPDRPSVDSLDGQIPSRPNRPQRRIEEMGRPPSSPSFRKFQEEGPSAALDQILGIGDPIARGDRLRGLLDELSSDDLVKIIDSFWGKRSNQFQGEYLLAVYALVEKDPSVASASKNPDVIKAYSRIARLEADGQ